MAIKGSYKGFLKGVYKGFIVEFCNIGALIISIGFWGFWGIIL